MKQNNTLRIKLGLVIFLGIQMIANSLYANSFIENKGQITTLNGQSTKEILFTAEANGKKIFIAKDGFYFQSITATHDSMATIECIKLQFIGTNNDAKGNGIGQ